MRILFECWGCYGEFGRAERRTADPSASLGMTKGRATLPMDSRLLDRGMTEPKRRTVGRSSGVWIQIFYRGIT